MDTNFLQRLIFNADGHIPTVIQDATTNRVLTVCYLNDLALQKTLEEGYVYVYRRSLAKLMMKGEVSGHTQKVRSIEVDCEGKSLLIRIDQKVAGCHKGYFSCFFEAYDRVAKHFSIGEKQVFDPAKTYSK